MKAVVVDKDYGSVSAAELERVTAAYEAAGIQVDLLDYRVDPAQQKEPTEASHRSCQGAADHSGNRNPPIHPQSPGIFAGDPLCTALRRWRQQH